MDAITISLPSDLIDEITRQVIEAVLSRLEARASDLMTPKEAAEYLHCKPQRIYDLKSHGDLPALKEGDRVLIRRADLDARLVED